MSSNNKRCLIIIHVNVIKWKHFPRYWPFVRENHRSPVNSPYKGQWRGALMFSLICAWASGWTNNRGACDLRRQRAHYEWHHYNDIVLRAMSTLHWRHNGREFISNDQSYGCLLNRLFWRILKKTSKLRVTGLCKGNSPGTGEFPAQMASNADKVFHLMTSSCSYIVLYLVLDWGDKTLVSPVYGVGNL